MKGYYTPCQACGIRPSTEMHHCFAQTKWAVRKYGERIHDLANIQFVCHTCHSGCGSKIKRFTEQEFLEATKGVTNEL